MLKLGIITEMSFRIPIYRDEKSNKFNNNERFLVAPLLEMTVKLSYCRILN